MVKSGFNLERSSIVNYEPAQGHNCLPRVVDRSRPQMAAQGHNCLARVVDHSRLAYANGDEKTLTTFTL